jgi:carbon storage regulator
MRNRKWQRTPYPKLILARRLGERIIIPQHDMILAVERITPSEVRISISAPKDVDIYREEVWQSLQSSTQP